MSTHGKNKQIRNFDGSLGELEKLLERIESEELSLEEALKAYERGINLIRTAQKALSEAEQRFQLLTDTQGDPISSSFLEEDEQ